MQALFALDPSEHGRRLFASQANGLDGVMEKPHTLEDYAVDHFGATDELPRAVGLGVLLRRGLRV